VLKEYSRALAGFSEKTLAKGWDLAKSEHKTWVWPHFSVIREACRKYSGETSPVSSEIQGKMPWEVAAAQRETMVKDYLESYQNSALALQAMQEGWGMDLLRYVRELAQIQAQMLVSSPSGIGWDGGVVFGYGTQISEDMRKAFFADQRIAIGYGGINVNVPERAINEWRSRASRKEARA
jgi:hypothetical protein